MKNGDKWRLARLHKDHGVALFAAGNVEMAFEQFSMALKYIISLAHNVPESEHSNEVSRGFERKFSVSRSCFL